jgi:hypothetical protein
MMKKMSMNHILWVGLLVCTWGLAGVPEFGKMLTIQVNHKPLDLEGGIFAAPQVVDWDQDGKKDLLLGEFCGHTTEGRYRGKIRFYSNTGTDANPEFGHFNYLTADAKPITVSQH